MVAVCMIQNYGLVGLGVTGEWPTLGSGFNRPRLHDPNSRLRAYIVRSASTCPGKTWDADYRERMRMTPIQFQPSQRLPDPEKLWLIRADSRHSVLFRVPKRSGILGSDP